MPDQPVDATSSGINLFAKGGVYDASETAGRPGIWLGHPAEAEIAVKFLSFPLIAALRLQRASNMAIALTVAPPAESAATTSAQAPPVPKSVTLNQNSTKSQPQSTDTVQISNDAQTALQESLELPNQTAKEARNGDHQAQRLLAKELAAQKT